MLREIAKSGGVLLAVWALGALAVSASELTPGDVAPNFHGLPGTDGEKHGLADYRDAKAIVLVFTCNHCPVASGYEERLVALQKQYRGKGVQFMAINVSTMPADRLAAMQQRAKEKDFNFPYLYDASQKIGRDYGAAVTPHIFLLDKNRKIAYVGAIDDNLNPRKVKTHYLADALDSLLAGKKPPQETTKAFGCGIHYE
jgi:peroxiredoxin